MAEAIIGPLVGRLQELALGEARALVGVNADMQKLRDKLMWLQAFLREADAKRRAVSDEVTKVWVMQTRDAVFDAEDALDHYYLQLEKSKYPWWVRPTMKCVTTFTVEIHMRHKLARKIQAINSRLEDIIQNKSRYKIEEARKSEDATWKASTSISYTHRTWHSLHESNAEIYEKERAELEKALVTQPEESEGEGNQRPLLITVFGKSGIGKTTLIVQQLTEDNRNCPRKEVRDMFKEKFTDKKYLLVIDGEVSSTEWNDIWSCLLPGLVQSKERPAEWNKFEAHEASFTEVHSDDDIPTLTSSRRLSLQNYTNKYAILAHPLPKLRSIFSQFEQKPKIDEETLSRKMQDIICWSPQQRSAYDRNRNIKSHIKELLHGSEFLRVINMQGIEIGKKLSHAIGNVVHLQYLGITSCSLEHISSSIGRLTNLQTLDVRETNVRKLPKAFWMIETLRHVFGFCLELPKQIGNLKHLLTLDSICLKEHKDALEMTLGEMIHLELLVVWNISDSNVKALSSALKKLENLRTMILHGKIEVSSPFHSLKCMVLDGEVQNHLFNTKGMPNLIMLTLMITKVNQVFIDKLAELPSLAILTLCAGSYTEKELVFTSATFRCLSKLKVDVEELENVEINLKMLPKLQKCEIISHQTHQSHELVMSNEEGYTNFKINLLEEKDAVQRE
ncbi:hypothetical protein GUJ93_ZPchr0013g34885 [Zizania palustris]|uniref:Rx N-terminal domain-containing protein n=1 Tax=Zizania palustris TaxID=103762 RepID=A0A8J6C578_ZIZPA|nr:hypothetical protein GUJ93_ZPchr0013g34885 [Zizania palustris]